MPGHISRTRLATTSVLATTIALLASGCANDPIGQDNPTTTRFPGTARFARGSLSTLSSCDELLDYFKSHSLEQLEAQSVMYSGGWAMEDASASAEVSSDMARTAAPMASSAAGAGAADGAGRQSTGFDESTTGTNNQEVGVDEADMIKTDGRRIVSVRGNELIVVELVDGAATVTGRLALPADGSYENLFLTGDRVMVLGTGWREDVAAASVAAGAADVAMDRSWMPGSSLVTVTEISLDGTPRIVDLSEVEGSIVDARMVDGTVRVVTTSSPMLAYPTDVAYPTGNSEAEWKRYQDEQLAAQRATIESTTIDEWLPNTADGGQVAGCANTMVPEEFAGTETLSVLTYANGAASLQATSVVAGAGSVYASTDSLYVATTTWVPMATGNLGGDVTPMATTRIAGSDSVTDIHAFSTSGTASATYVGSGRLDGRVLNQYSMSEADGHLRVAVTRGNWNDGDSGVVTLRRTADGLATAGEVWGLGPGETIQSVRYVGDTAYVVTFRQTDPFYVVDVADPTAPKVLGELKVPGFSNYLHPVGERLVLGVGVDADNDGRTTGAKVSLYDTSDPTNPRELDTWTSNAMQFQTGWDPHSFSWDAERGIAYITYQDACFDFMGNCSYSGDGGALAIQVANGALTELTKLTHRNRTPIVVPPEDTTPDTTAPETTVPETTVPETTVPETTTTTEPTTSVPATTAPVSGSSAGSSAASAGAAQSEMAQDEMTQSEEPSVTPAAPPVGLPMPVDPGIGDGSGDFGGVDQEFAFPITRAFTLGDSVVTWSWWGIGIFRTGDYALTGFASF